MIPGDWHKPLGDRTAGRRPWPGLLLIGGTGRNAGKTRFVCEVIKHFQTQVPLVGLKVTTVRDPDAPCPRGQPSCGVCAALDAPFRIDEERDLTSGKDTAQMLASGATPVLWLRVRIDHLADGAAALFEAVGPRTLCVGESNSLGLVVRPDLFLMVRSRGRATWKPSAREAMAWVDREVMETGASFDLSPSDLDLHQGRWTCRPAQARTGPG